MNVVPDALSRAVAIVEATSTDLYVLSRQTDESVALQIEKGKII